VIRVYNAAGNVIAMHEHKGNLEECCAWTSTAIQNQRLQRSDASNVRDGFS